MHRFAALMLSLFVAGIFTGCAATHSSSSNNPNGGGSENVSVSLSPTSATLNAGATQQFSATVSGSNNQTVNWSVDHIAGGNSQMGTITSAGLYTAPANAGKHTVTATSVASASASASASVTVNAAAAGALIISPTSVHVAAGASRQFTATINGGPAPAKWLVDNVARGNATVGTISANGVYTAPANAGTHTITAVTPSNPNNKANAQVLPPTVVLGSVAVSTFHNDNGRTGANTSEISLTPTTVGATTFGKIFSLPVDGQVYAQPLYVPNFSMQKSNHNLLIVATEHDSVYAFDADGLSTAPLWHVNFTNPVAGVTTAPSCAVQASVRHIVPEVGITSTPVIDPSSQTIYVVAETKEPSGYVFRLHALDITSGAEKFGGPVIIQGSVPGASPWESDGAGHVVLNPADGLQLLQRAALLLQNGTVYVAFGSHQDQNPYHGWVFAFNAASLAQTAAFNTTPNGTGANGGKGAIWQSGGGPAGDATNSVYVATGNGTFDASNGGADYGDSAIRLSNSLAVQDWFTPANEATLEQTDKDFGASGPVALPDQMGTVSHLLVEGTKDGRLVVLNRDSMGHFNPAGDTQIVQEITGVGPVFSTPAFWNQNLYLFGINDIPRQYSLGANGTLSPSASNGFIFGYPGATPSVSANGTSNGIVWAVDAHGFAKAASCSLRPNGGPAVLRAYDATNISKELYNSQAQGARDAAGPALQFITPTVVNGHVYIGTQNSVTVYGPLG
jgi:hypothetical protein